MLTTCIGDSIRISRSPRCSHLINLEIEQGDTSVCGDVDMSIEDAERLNELLTTYIDALHSNRAK